MQQHLPRSTLGRDLLGLVIIITLLFGINLGFRPLSVPDEARYAEIPREMVMSQDYITPHLNTIKYFEKPPLFYWLQAAAIKTWGLNEWAVRIPNALLAVLGCVFTYLGGRCLYGRAVGWLASLMLATSILYFGLAHLVTLDMAVTSLLTGCLLSFLWGMQAKQTWQRQLGLYSSYSFAALVILTKGLIGLLLPTMIIGIWIILQNDWQLLKQMRLVSGLLLLVVIAAPWHYWVQQANPEFLHFYFIEQQFSRYLTLYAGRYQPAWFFLPIVTIGFFPWVVFALQAGWWHLPKSWAACRRQRANLFLVIWVVAVLGFFSCSKSKLIPYILPIFPALAIITAHYLLVVGQQETKSLGIKIGVLLLVILGMALGLALFALPHFHALPNPKLGGYFLKGLGMLLIAVTILTSIIFMQGHRRLALLSLGLGMVSFLLILVAAVPYVDGRSIKPLAESLKPLLKADDKLVVFGNYYQDLPVYLERPVMIVDWVNELQFGSEHQDTRQLLLTSEQFWPLWHSSQRVYMITSLTRFEQMKRRQLCVPEACYVLAMTRDQVLVANHLDKSAKKPYT